MFRVRNKDYYYLMLRIRVHELCDSVYDCHDCMLERVLVCVLRHVNNIMSQVKRSSVT